MNNSPKKTYLIIPLIFSLLALIAVAILGLMKGAMSLGMYTPDNPDTINLALTISAAVIVIGLGVYAMLAPESVRAFLSGRQARYGSNAVIMILAFAGIIFAANYLAFKNPKDLVDMTEDKTNTLSPEMIQALQGLPAKMTATGFYSQTPRDNAEQLLSNMKANSKGKFDYTFVNPDADPVAAKNAGVTGDGKIVLEMEGRHEIAAYADETELLSAMSRLLNPEARTVYFLTGHGELEIDGSGVTGMNRAAETLRNKNYTVKTLSLLSQPTVPEDARAVIVAGPKQPLDVSEVGALNKYVQNGGAVIVMEDPTPLTDLGDQPDPLAESLARVWGITLRNDFIVDTASTVIQNAIGEVYNPSSPITSAMNLYTIFPLARSLDVAVQAPEGVTLKELVQTNPASQAWGETDFAPLSGGNAQVALDPQDTPGPLTIAASGEHEVTKGRVVVFGNSVFASDEGFDVRGNGDLFVHAVDWCAGAKQPIDITRSTTPRTFNPPSQLAWISILLGSVCLVPALVIAAGVAAWASRKREG